ncbi:sushi, von Willebrand factor type A, EGF and pentraxin domain-containing protein 1-like [Ruditapes philippinarum]|uniref:sushi, von Willebrand factor type A, EGF and pentraxin domain-containing protein 1-like n=1 Tax=Ruditapes philippinarum TaxID=129788 RepID=UPI00295B8247|nr:sushi, von Willebrand factor type A, EGF and pentraxin domain-containing protein 1-like [Ruditapes philippinarum]
MAALFKVRYEHITLIFGAYSSVILIILTVVTTSTSQPFTQPFIENMTDNLTDCGLVPEVLNGNTILAFEGYTQLGERAVVECDKGYHINGTLSKFGFIFCRQPGTWDLRTCSISDCRSPPNDTLNGEFILDEEGVTTYGANATLTCIEGYESNDSVITCEEFDTWSKYEPCLMKDCKTVPIIERGTIMPIDSDNTTYGAVAKVTCISGYNSSKEYIQCLSNGTWEIVTCEKIDCRLVPEVLNGNTILAYEGYTQLGERAVVECDKGYHINATLSKFGFIFCRQPGTWDLRTCSISDCRSPPNDTLNGEFILDEEGVTTYGANATLTCIEGYESNDSVITCEEFDTWSKYEPCLMKDCKTVLVIERGTIMPIDSDNTTYGAVANVTCDYGYNSSKEYIQCLSNGTWESVTCKKIDCGDVPLLDYGSIALQIDGNSSYGALANVTCDTGYNTTLHTIQCQITGQWQDTTCTVVDCGDVPFINDGNIFLQEEGNSSYGALAKVTCNTGYNTTSDTIQCLDTGEWDNRTCTIVDCGDVPFINDGNILLQEGGNSSYGALAEVTCNTGYNATLNAIVCQDTGEWNNITCNIIDCGNVPSVLNGRIELNEDGNTSYGALAEVICDTGYNKSRDIIECHNTGEWDKPTCDLKDCGTVPLINGGSITLNKAVNSTYGAIAEVRCNTGYNTTLPTIECGDNGKWDNTTCDIVDCGKVPSISNGSIDLIEDGNTTYGALAEVTCDTGYNGTLNVIECRDTGEWNVTECNLIDCGNVPQLDNGNVVLKVDGLSSYGADAVVTCEQGYNATSKTIQCLDTGKWDNISCGIVDCGEVPVVTKGTVTLLEVNNTTYSALANISCETGYNASIGIIQCLETGLWETTGCQILDCDAVPDVLNGIVALQEAENTTYGKLSEVICNVGYNATSETILCLETGKWETPQCEILDCEAAPVIANGQITLTQDGNTTYGAIASVSCSTGYNATVDTILCLETGEWDNATCDSIDCGNLPSISNGSITLIEDGNTTYGALAEVICDTGYNETLNIIECLDTGEWDVTECKLLDCGHVPQLDNGAVELKVDRLSSYGTEAIVTCEQGYNATSKTIQCLDTGKWDKISCEIVDCGKVPVVTKGTVTLLEVNNTTYSALANVSCETGYNASIGIIQCLETGLWETTECQILGI